MKISVIIPCYNEQEVLTRTIEELSVQMAFTDDYELLFVDDGSTDQTWHILTQQAANIPQLKALRLSRNFGKEAAICAGLDRADGDAVILIDADLQHPPDAIPQMVALWHEGYEVVEGVKRSRGKESLFSRLNAGLFYGLFQKTSGLDLHNASDYKLLDRKVVLAWRQLRERDTFFRGLSAWLGYRRTVFYFEVAEREGGESKWPIRKLIRLSITAITGFSSKPLLLIAIFGIFLLIGFVVLGIQTLVNWFSGHAIEGFTTVILLQLLIGGFLLFSLALIGLYIAQIFNEIKGRPRYLISERLD